MVRQAVEGALHQLRQQQPGVVCSRRDRSLERSLPLLSRALAGERAARERQLSRRGMQHWGSQGLVLAAGLQPDTACRPPLTRC